MKRALEIIVRIARSIGHQYPRLNGAVNNYAALLEAIGKTREQIIAALREIVLEIFS